MYQASCDELIDDSVTCFPSVVSRHHHHNQSTFPHRAGIKRAPFLELRNSQSRKPHHQLSINYQRYKMRSLSFTVLALISILSTTGFASPIADDRPLCPQCYPHKCAVVNKPGANSCDAARCSRTICETYGPDQCTVFYADQSPGCDACTCVKA